MFDIHDMFRQAQGGQAIDNFARQFGLNTEAAQAAMRALAPAFAAGAARNMADPFGMQKLMSTLQSQRHQAYFTDPMAVFTPAGRMDGNDILGQLFGSKDFSRALADQVAGMTGVGADILRDMLPAMAAMFMGGLEQYSATNPAAGAMQAFFEGFARGRPEPRAEPKMPAMSDLMEAFFSGFSNAASGDDKADNIRADNPMVDLMRAGESAQADYLRAYEDLFNRFWSPPR